MAISKFTPIGKDKMKEDNTYGDWVHIDDHKEIIADMNREIGFVIDNLKRLMKDFERM